MGRRCTGFEGWANHGVGLISCLHGNRLLAAHPWQVPHWLSCVLLRICDLSFFRTRHMMRVAKAVISGLVRALVAEAIVGNTQRSLSWRSFDIAQFCHSLIRVD